MEFVDIAKAFLEAVTGELDKWTEENGVIVTNEQDQKVTLFTPQHVQFARYGRGPGKKPPLDPLLKWVIKKGIVEDIKDAKGTAFAIQNSISTKGTKNWDPNGGNFIQEVINDNLKEYYKNLNASIFIEQNNEVINIMETLFPEKIEIKI